MLIPKGRKVGRIRDKRSRPPDALEKEHMQRIANMGCLVCGMPAEVHHVKDGAGGKRDHRYIAPLCPRHHRITVDSKVSYEALGRAAFDEMLGFDLLEWCKEQWRITNEMALHK